VTCNNNSHQSTILAKWQQEMALNAADLGWIRNLTLLSTPKPRRLMAPSLRSGSAGLNWMPPLFNTPREAVTITASPAVQVHMVMHHATTNPGAHIVGSVAITPAPDVAFESNWAHHNWMLLQKVHKNSRQILQASTSRRVAQRNRSSNGQEPISL